ncbi:MAG: redoxin domain-containing protein [Candidatus Marinimicrobia bacterium]|nr:redoxin domain-containing protein [Candidatus Neomarinimicrobiota bacterium]
MTEAAGFQSNIYIYKEANIEVIGISADTPTAQRKFADRLGITYPLICDEEKRVIKRFGAFGKKKLYGKEYIGIIRSTFILDKDNIVLHVFKKVSPKKHQDEIFQIMNLHG